jgi:hypothetical protein
MQMHEIHHVEVGMNRVGYTEKPGREEKGRVLLKKLLLFVTGHETMITRVHTVHR